MAHSVNHNKVAAAKRANCKLVMPATAPHKAEPKANEPNADSTCKEVARERTQGGALVWVAVLNVDMTDIQAAMGIHQLGKLEGFQARRRAVVTRYREALGDAAEIQLPVELDNVSSAWHLFPIRLHLDRLDIDRSQFIDQLAERNIGSSVHFIPLHLHPFYRDKYGFVPEQFPVAWREYQRLVSLPLSPRLSDDDVDDVVAAVLDIVAGHRR